MGADSCKTCHQAIYDSWAGTKHAKALSRVQIQLQKCLMATSKVFAYMDADPEVAAWAATRAPRFLPPVKTCAGAAVGSLPRIETAAW